LIDGELAASPLDSSDKVCSPDSCTALEHPSTSIASTNSAQIDFFIPKFLPLIIAKKAHPVKTTPSFMKEAPTSALDHGAGF